MEMSSERRACISVAVVKPMGTSFDAEHGQLLSLYSENENVVTFCQDLGSLLLRYTLDLLEDLPRCICHRLDGIVPAIDKQLDVSFGETRDALQSKIRRNLGICGLSLLTSSDESGVGAPGPPPDSSNCDCSSSALMLATVDVA